MDVPSEGPVAFELEIKRAGAREGRAWTFARMRARVASSVAVAATMVRDWNGPRRTLRAAYTGAAALRVGGAPELQNWTPRLSVARIGS